MHIGSVVVKAKEHWEGAMGRSNAFGRRKIENIAHKTKSNAPFRMGDVLAGTCSYSRTV